ncbi:uncharacterized protein [Littorina saxatilis]
MATRRSSRKRSASRMTSSSSEDQTQNETDINTNASSKSVLSTPVRVPLPGMTDGSLLLSTGMETPLRTRGLQHLRQRIEEELGRQPGSGVLVDNTSPGLARLRNTPGLALKEKQKELMVKHEQIRQNSDKLNVGGGVTLWPNMNQMRLSRKEIIVLIITCFLLMGLTGWLFLFLHGETFHTMWKFTSRLKGYGNAHPIKGTGNVKSSVLSWHSNFRNLLDGIDKSLNVTRPSLGYQVYVASYLAGLGVLVYFLIDNMFSKSKLSPGRIKKWVCFLVVVAQWTVMLSFMFVSAHKVEAAVVENVHQISEKMGEFVEHDLDLTTLSAVVQYWRGRCLPPTAPGVIHVLGLVPVQDVAVYLQYYSLPVLTVLLTPVVRLCLALRTVYSPVDRS